MATKLSANVVRVLVALSMATSVAWMGTALLHTRAIQIQLTQSFAGVLLAFALAVIICSWPWYAAMARAGERRSESSVIAFGIVAVMLSAGGAESLKGAPIEGIGWTIIVTVLAIWVLYPVSLLLRGAEDKDA